MIGAGPVGLAAGLLARDRGFDVSILEAGGVGQAMSRWGSTRLFSPYSMNAPDAFRRRLGNTGPRDDSLLTGPEMVDAGPRPIAACADLRAAIHIGHRVVAVGRSGMTRMDFPGHPLRSERPFRILAETPDGERIFEADVVFDASGAGRACCLGSGGLPAPGEHRLGGDVIRDLGSLDERLAELGGRTVLLLGHGHSAANGILRLAELCRGAPATRVVWAVRSAHVRPCVEIAEDPLPERQRVAAGANDLAADPPPFLRVERRAGVERIDGVGNRLTVSLSGGRAVECDSIVALTGYRPNLSFLSELALEISPVSEGPARLWRALSGVADCLRIPSVSAGDLDSGEPGFFFVGAKSYGRSRNFLLRTGLAHLQTVFEGLSAR